LGDRPQYGVVELRPAAGHWSRPAGPG
jgi:hypothetical protein